ncbi:uncharacterized protein LOC127256451 [Andrographis paniculata]|uniref:uncharacterized protein LOC127256451 n=1 Tax=Andrographis paniculata TaxID=175694 RepID=UPI0021E94A9D|nr:uncharacterized protein LOC127256451 [Andrographis paniculata]
MPLPVEAHHFHMQIVPSLSALYRFSPLPLPTGALRFSFNSQFVSAIRNFSPNRLAAAAAGFSGNRSSIGDLPPVVLDSLRVLQWDQLCDSVASFAGTSLGKQATKDELWNLDKTYEDSVRLLQETNAAVEMNNYGAMMDFTGMDVALVESGIRCARRGFPVSGNEATALLSLLKYSEALQLNVKSAIKEDSYWFKRFMPLSEMVIELVINQRLVKLIEQLVDEDGSVKDSASSDLRRARDQVRSTERKLYQLLESIRNETKEAPSLEICDIDGRWCLKTVTATYPSFEGLLLSSGSGMGNLVEPLSAVSLNDELQQARASVAKAETEVLLRITKKMQEDLGDIEDLFNIMIRIDMINARAKYSLSFGGAYPDLYLLEDKNSNVSHQSAEEDKNPLGSQSSQKKWSLYLPRAYHPLLLQQHRYNVKMTMKDLSNANAELRRKKQQGKYAKWAEQIDSNISSLQMQVDVLKQTPPVPFDIFIAMDTRVVVITGPNTGGKTICLKTVGLAAMMAKSGLYILASEPARIPWFDFVLADIGDEQSLSQSLSTFSGHLKQISEIKSLSTKLSLVLLDEVGAGTNPLEGAALGMSLLESFAESGSLLTIATTHHGELKSLKYSNSTFENACMEFDEVNLKPTYKILWGVPGRSNAINIAERLGLPVEILDGARELYGAASAEINEIIVDMERFKQDCHKNVHEAEHYLRLSKELHQSLLLRRKRVMEQSSKKRYRMIQEISNAAASARSIIHKKVREARLLPTQPSNQIKSDLEERTSVHIHHAKAEEHETSAVTEATLPLDHTKQSKPEKKTKLPKVGDMVNVPSLHKRATVLKLDLSKDEIVVQAGNLKLKLKLADVAA